MAKTDNLLELLWNEREELTRRDHSTCARYFVHLSDVYDKGYSNLDII